MGAWRLAVLSGSAGFDSTAATGTAGVGAGSCSRASIACEASRIAPDVAELLWYAAKETAIRIVATAAKMSWPGLSKRRRAKNVEAANSGCVGVAATTSSLGEVQAGLGSAGRNAIVACPVSNNVGHAAPQLWQFVASC
jgi:hypothetical protein